MAYVLLSFIMRRIRSSKSSSVADKGRKGCFPPALGPSDLDFFLPQEPDGGLVVLSGGGTSDRMAFLMAVSTLIPCFFLLLLGITPRTKRLI